MRTEEIKIYKFKELNKDIQEKVISDYRTKNEYEFLSDNLKECLFQELEKHKIHVVDEAKHYFSLAYCQGDGYMFFGRYKWKNYNVFIEHSGHYFHSNSKNITIETIHGNEAKDEVYTAFEEIYKEICDTQEKQGYSEIEQEDSEENIKDLIEMNEYEFLENGEVF